MYCYVINLPSATRRLACVSRELELYCPGIGWSVPKMYVASDMAERDFTGLYDAKRARLLHQRDLSKGEIACALSHQAAMREFLNSGENSCLIVEDDVLFSPAIGLFLKDLELWLKCRCDIPICVVLSEAHAVRYWTARKWLGKIKRTHPIEIFGALAYVLNRAGAELVLRINSVPIHTLSDYWSYYKKFGLYLYGVDKVLAGSFDFERTDSSLSEGRAVAAALSKTKITTYHKIVRFLKSRLRKGWWILTGVKEARSRVNERVYEYRKRFDASHRK